ncbi:hypothetical protein CUJ83_12285 [Methanocella sp. CWC-04]|uniref:Uncharacterized protein n=1 Tax=Methanooceanicella nereidis TaxID=2052831 RepID=A0AAP2REM8_9EURY|nr:hypothetical protein [Methanocella sp. CWC-04]MCD1295777.1 hypothetical protein [Methanocella sp. CWC-04]
MPDSTKPMYYGKVKYEQNGVNIPKRATSTLLTYYSCGQTTSSFYETVQASVSGDSENHKDDDNNKNSFMYRLFPKSDYCSDVKIIPLKGSEEAG